MNDFTENFGTDLVANDYRVFDWLGALKEGKYWRGGLTLNLGTSGAGDTPVSPSSLLIHEASAAVVIHP